MAGQRVGSMSSFALSTLHVRSALLLIAVASGNLLANEVRELDGLDVTEHLNDELPLRTVFKDDTGNAVRLGEYFDGSKPVILSLNYSNCPQLCQLQLNGLVDALQEMEGDAGRDFQVVSISIDPSETTSKARETKQKYVKLYDRAGTGNGWHFLVGSGNSIASVAKATGFRYRYIPEKNEFAHPAVLMLCTPDGRISRYLYGIEFDVSTLRLSLVEASEGKIGKTVEHFLLYCFDYDETSGRYAPVAVKIMKFGAGVTVACLLIGLVPYWVRSWRQSKHSEPMSATYR